MASHDDESHDAGSLSHYVSTLLTRLASTTSIASASPAKYDVKSESSRRPTIVPRRSRVVETADHAAFVNFLAVKSPILLDVLSTLSAKRVISGEPTGSFQFLHSTGTMQ